MDFMRSVCFLILQSILVQCETDDNGNYIDDEKRPYKFGFNIEGYQHRYEEKDSRGIIMGEFGFITGDGVYHLTVYATDENGKFKILKMKNTYIGLPMDKSESTTTPPRVTNGKFTGLAACGGCIVPSTPSPGDLKLDGVNPSSKSFSSPNQFKSNVGSLRVPANKTPTMRPSTQNRVAPNEKQQAVNADSDYPNGNKRVEASTPTSEGVSGGRSIQEAQTSDNPPKPPKLTSRNSFRDTPRESISPLMGLLYKFNYTLTYHGHAETGDRAGVKNGSYFFDGWDGFIRNVTYTANENGYQPNISLIAVNSKEPEKGKENELLWNEFKWYN